MAEKTTVMVLKVDLQCPCCYKKVKKILCKFPQIRNQVYDEKNNTVIITVVCCSPEKIRNKLCCKGSKVIKSIEIKKPPKPNPNEDVPKHDQPKKPDDVPKPDPPKKPEDSPERTPICYPLPYPGGPCYHGYGRPIPPPSYCTCGCGGYGYGYGYGRGCYVIRCDYYCSEENTQACSIM